MATTEATILLWPSWTSACWAVGAIRTLTYATHVVGFILWGGLFALFGAHAFFLFAAFYTAVAGAYLWLARSLKK